MSSLFGQFFGGRRSEDRQEEGAHTAPSEERVGRGLTRDLMLFPPPRVRAERASHVTNHLVHPSLNRIRMQVSTTALVAQPEPSSLPLVSSLMSSSSAENDGSAEEWEDADNVARVERVVVNKRVSSVATASEKSPDHRLPAGTSQSGRGEVAASEASSARGRAPGVGAGAVPPATAPSGVAAPAKNTLRRSEGAAVAASSSAATGSKSFRKHSFGRNAANAVRQPASERGSYFSASSRSAVGALGSARGRSPPPMSARAAFPPPQVAAAPPPPRPAPTRFLPDRRIGWSRPALAPLPRSLLFHDITGKDSAGASLLSPHRRALSVDRGTAAARGSLTDRSTSTYRGAPLSTSTGARDTRMRASSQKQRHEQAAPLTPSRSGDLTRSLLAERQRSGEPGFRNGISYRWGEVVEQKQQVRTVPRIVGAAAAQPQQSASARGPTRDEPPEARRRDDPHYDPLMEVHTAVDVPGSSAQVFVPVQLQNNFIVASDADDNASVHTVVLSPAAAAGVLDLAGPPRSMQSDAAAQQDTTSLEIGSVATLSPRQYSDLDTAVLESISHNVRSDGANKADASGSSTDPPASTTTVPQASVGAARPLSNESATSSESARKKVTPSASTATGNAGATATSKASSSSDSSRFTRPADRQRVLDDLPGTPAMVAAAAAGIEAQLPGGASVIPTAAVSTATGRAVPTGSVQQSSSSAASRTAFPAATRLVRPSIVRRQSPPSVANRAAGNVFPRSRPVERLRRSNSGHASPPLSRRQGDVSESTSRAAPGGFGVSPPTLLQLVNRAQSRSPPRNQRSPLHEVATARNRHAARAPAASGNRNARPASPTSSRILVSMKPDDALAMRYGLPADLEKHPLYSVYVKAGGRVGPAFFNHLYCDDAIDPISQLQIWETDTPAPPEDVGPTGAVAKNKTASRGTTTTATGFATSTTGQKSTSNKNAAYATRRLPEPAEVKYLISYWENGIFCRGFAAETVQRQLQLNQALVHPVSKEPIPDSAIASIKKLIQILVEEKLIDPCEEKLPLNYSYADVVAQDAGEQDPKAKIAAMAQAVFHSFFIEATLDLDESVFLAFTLQELKAFYGELRTMWHRNFSNAEQRELRNSEFAFLTGYPTLRSPTDTVLGWQYFLLKEMAACFENEEADVMLKKRCMYLITAALVQVSPTVRERYSEHVYVDETATLSRSDTGQSV